MNRDKTNDAKRNRATELRPQKREADPFRFCSTCPKNCAKRATEDDAALATDQAMVRRLRTWRA